METRHQDQPPVIEIKNLDVFFGHGESANQVVKSVNLNIDLGETVALIGESGSGKSVTALSILQLLPYPLAAHSDTSSIRFQGAELVNEKESVLRKIRGNQISMIFQEPMTSLNPLHTVGKQIVEVLTLHKGLNKTLAKKRAIELLDLVKIPDPQGRFDSYPHQLSGGQRQRVMIAMALANDPEVLIADEPTTAVDVTVQAQLLELLAELQQRIGMSILFITHDLRVVKKIAQRVYVMKSGEIVESGTTDSVFSTPTHEYTKRLLSSQPSGTPDTIASDAKTLVAIKDVKVWFPIKRGIFRKTIGHIKAVDEVSFDIKEGETVGLVGESGSGKSSLGQAILRLISCEGSIHFQDQELNSLSLKELRPFRRLIQVVFQDPFGSLSPRMTIGQIVGEGLNLLENIQDAENAVDQALTEVGLDVSMKNRYPHEFSGGQRQRIAIARALILKPKLIILDEPTSALDLSIQSQIIELLRSLQRKYSMSYLFISHDLNVIRALCHKIIVMKDGKFVETGSSQEIFEQSKNAYTRALIDASIDIVSSTADQT
ncbi:MAG: ABC transporter ATP-binding protein [Betaproteobacteria bacterium]